MSGHSKWNNIKNRKGKQDAERGKIFTKIGREIQVAVKEGGSDIQGNAKLKEIISKAKANNMPNSTIENAIKKASGDGNKSTFSEIIYEGYGSGGVAFVLKALTDNKNRTASEVRYVFDRNGGALGEPGSVLYMFSQKGEIVILKENVKQDEDEFMLELIEQNAEDIKTFDEVYVIYTEPKNFYSVLEYIKSKGIETLEAGIKYIASTNISLSEDKYEKQEKLKNLLEDLDDVQEVYFNAEEE